MTELTVLEQAIRKFIDEGRLRWVRMDAIGQIDPAVAGELAAALLTALEDEAYYIRSVYDDKDERE